MELSCVKTEIQVAEEEVEDGEVLSDETEEEEKTKIEIYKQVTKTAVVLPDPPSIPQLETNNSAESTASAYVPLLAPVNSTVTHEIPIQIQPSYHVELGQTAPGSTNNVIPNASDMQMQMQAIMGNMPFLNPLVVLSSCVVALQSIGINPLMNITEVSMTNNMNSTQNGTVNNDSQSLVQSIAVFQTQLANQLILNSQNAIIRQLISISAQNLENQQQLFNLQNLGNQQLLNFQNLGSQQLIKSQNNGNQQQQSNLHNLVNHQMLNLQNVGNQQSLESQQFLNTSSIQNRLLLISQETGHKHPLSTQNIGNQQLLIPQNVGSQQLFKTPSGNQQLLSTQNTEYQQFLSNAQKHCSGIHQSHLLNSQNDGNSAYPVDQLPNPHLLADPCLSRKKRKQKRHRENLRKRRILEGIRNVDLNSTLIEAADALVPNNAASSTRPPLELENAQDNSSDDKCHQNTMEAKHEGFSDDEDLQKAQDVQDHISSDNEYYDSENTGEVQTRNSLKQRETQVKVEEVTKQPIWKATDKSSGHTKSIPKPAHNTSSSSNREGNGTWKTYAEAQTVSRAEAEHTTTTRTRRHSPIRAPILTEDDIKNSAIWKRDLEKTWHDKALVSATKRRGDPESIEIVALSSISLRVRVPQGPDRRSSSPNVCRQRRSVRRKAERPCSSGSDGRQSSGLEADTSHSSSGSGSVSNYWPGHPTGREITSECHRSGSPRRRSGRGVSPSFGRRRRSRSRLRSGNAREKGSNHVKCNREQRDRDAGTRRRVNNPDPEARRRRIRSKRSVGQYGDEMSNRAENYNNVWDHFPSNWN